MSVVETMEGRVLIRIIADFLFYYHMMWMIMEWTMISKYYYKVILIL